MRLPSLKLATHDKFTGCAGLQPPNHWLFKLASHQTTGCLGLSTTKPLIV
jgi:hypothetical protein